MAKISTFIISMLLLSLMVTIFVAYYASLTTNYASVTYSDNISALDKFSDINNATVGLQSQLQNQSPAISETGGFSGAFNIPGALMSTAWNALKVTWDSVRIFNDIVTSSFDNIPISDEQSSLVVSRVRLTIALIMFIIIVFVIIGIAMNRPEL